MTRVAAKELKNRLGKYIAMAQRGTTVEVTSRGKVVCRITPWRPLTEAEEDEEILNRLEAEGILRRGNGQPIVFRSRPAKMTPGKSAVEMLREERDER